ncbi:MULTISPECIES: YjbF family lipoprotein [Shewanella]|uniref:YjbF family lipoprotein n=1 Tax=Shewanella TaxID=22 RepID=UPI00005FC1F2|nr:MULTISPECIES: YjbF family lipoprotein [Shewanella]ABM24325.1 lipoprotein, putative [Shewanella sp. W3-18-1]MCA1896435.1 YjbF family lipoprotein [Shewanella putrefaciens]CAD6366060.1 putative lipoprotein GfcB [Shewanella hafniensis]SUI48456.1 Group 4 capsule protein B homolog [Shewanella putrefaciens]
MRINKNLVRLLTISTVLMGITGCSQRISALNDTIKLAFLGEDDVKLTSEQVKSNPYASIYAKIGDTPQAFVVLAFAEPKVTLSNVRPEPDSTELKWLSADNGMLVTINGRLIKTHNLLEGNLAAVESHEPDPIVLGLHLDNTPKTWTRTLDWQPGYHYGYKVTSQFKLIADENVLINDTPTQLLHYSETVSVEGLNIQYQNDFWLKPDNGHVVKSRQKIAPNLPFIDIILLKPFAS